MEYLHKQVIVTIFIFCTTVAASVDFVFPSTILPLTFPDYSQILNYQNDTSFISKFCNAYCDGPVKKTAVTFQFQRNPRCIECSCDDYCDLFGDCCPDSLGNIRASRVDDSIRHICVWNTDDVQVNLRSGIAMLMSCPEANSSFITEDGRQMSFEENELAPVTSLATHLSYYNEHIAKCNGETFYVLWDQEEECSSSGYGSGAGSEDYDDFVLVDDDGDVEGYVDDHNCHYTFHLNGIRPRLCDPIVYSESIQECNITGLWSVSDDHLLDLCHGEKYPVEFVEVIFTNVFCFLCNGLIPDMYSESRGITVAETFTRITIITRFKQWPMQPDTKHISDCGKNSRWDPEKEICRQLFCPKGRTLKNKECLPVNGNAFGDMYSIEITLQPRDQHTTAAVEDWIFLTQMMKWYFQIKMANLHSTNYVFALAKNSLSLLRVSCKLLVTEYADRMELEENLLNLLSGEWQITFQGEHYIFLSSSAGTENDLTITKNETYWSDPVSGMCCNSVSGTFDLEPLNITTNPHTTQVTEHLTCPYVKLDAGDIVSGTNGWIELVYANVSLPRKYVSYLPNGQVSVCVETLISAYNGSGFGDITLGDDNVLVVQNLLSFVCVVVSLLCLACTFVTYCAFPILRTLPARNNMFLIVYLFLAQFLFQFGVGQTEHKQVCIIIGVLIHYLWLNVVLWMNVCSFHMFRVFFLSPARPTVSLARTKHMVRYIAYTNIVSFVIIGVTIGVSLLLSQGKHIGYGGYACYLATPTLVGFAFVLPLSIVLCSNIFFFVVTVFSISKIEPVHRHSGKERHNIYVYIKLSAMTGMFWIVSILSEILDIEALSYVAIVLNGSQGLLLFVCYGLNRRVLVLWKEVCSKVVEKYSPDVERNITESTNV